MPFDGVDTEERRASELMSSPKYMIAWLRRKAPDEIVMRSAWSGSDCLGARFLQENGYPHAYWLVGSGSLNGRTSMRSCTVKCHRSIANVIMELMRSYGPFTAADILSIFERKYHPPVRFYHRFVAAFR